MSSQKVRGVKGTRDVLPTDTYVKQDGAWRFRYRKIDRFIHD